MTAMPTAVSVLPVTNGAKKSKNVYEHGKNYAKLLALYPQKLLVPWMLNFVLMAVMSEEPNQTVNSCHARLIR